jgi:hypothetical protein
MNALPKSAQPGAKKALQEIYNAEDRTHAEKAVTAFEKAYGAKWPKATAKITGEVDELLAFYDFPAEHWIHLRTTNPMGAVPLKFRHFHDRLRGGCSRSVRLAGQLWRGGPAQNPRVWLRPSSGVPVLGPMQVGSSPSL